MIERTTEHRAPLQAVFLLPVKDNIMAQRAKGAVTIMSEPGTPHILIVGAATELGLEAVRQLSARGQRISGIAASDKEAAQIHDAGGTAQRANPSDSASLTSAVAATAPSVIINLTPQSANSLLHDGHAWKGFDTVLRDGTTALLEAAKSAHTPFVIHASYAFLYGSKLNAVEDDRLQPPSDHPAFAAALAAEQKFVESGIAHSILRLGFLYGQQSHALVQYKRSFDLHRAYYAGVPGNVSSMLHSSDAARALALVAERQPQGETFNVADDAPVWFGDFIDTFAHDVGKKNAPPHIPPRFVRLAGFAIKRPQVDILNLSTAVNSAKMHQQLDWSPEYPTYHEGLRAAAAALFPQAQRVAATR